jgi:SNF2 family DNA or RNA helicase
MLDIVERGFQEHGIKNLRFDGTMTGKRKDTALQKFREEKDLNVLLVSLKCGAVGLNLTCANHVIMLDVWWNPAIENQAIDRVHRFGQTKYYLMII